MRSWLLPLVVTALAAPCALAQQNLLLQTDFEAGLPSGWQLQGGTAAAWHIASAGECGAITNMLAFNRGPGACDIGAGSGAQGGIAHVVPIPISGQPPFKVAFDYILDIDASGDGVYLAVLTNSGSPLLFTSSSTFVNDGALHSIELEVPPLTTIQNELWLSFGAETDGVGDAGRGWLIDNVRFTTTNSGAVLCNGSAPSSCPCGNGGGTLRGCANSTGTGAGLSAIGRASLSADTLHLEANHLAPSSPALFFEGSSQVSLPFGNGRLCAGGTHRRLATLASASGTVVFPAIGQPSISAITQPSVGVHFYQVLYRDAAGPCGQPFNLTNGLSVFWNF